ncbi:hypothetical protein Tco_0770704 [Tanacetum coccineum]|uniref:Uncharacterized protein n=1 Tax=Tanacetum coccineum TaxID=301880 RepID=A0ABQ4ZGN9_9ASTR
MPVLYRVCAVQASLGSSFKSPLRGLKSVHLGKLHTKAVVVQKEFGDKILVPVPDLSQRPLKIEKICLDCGDPVHGLYCRQCALIRKTLEEVFQDFQDTSKSSNDDTKLWLIKAISLSKQDPGVNSSQSPQINHNCCYECGDSLDDIFCQRCTSFKEHSETIIDSNDDSTSSDDDSYENIDYVDASPPDAEIVSLEVVEIVIPEVGGIDTDILLTIKDDILREKLLNVNLLIANIEALKDNPAPSSDISSGSTTTRSDYSLPDYEAFYFDDDHIEEKSSGSTTTHADFSQYDSFIFDLSINPFPPADRSDFYHEEFADELAHIISPSEYDHFCFKIEPELGNLTMDVVEDIFPTREPRVHVPNVLSTHPTLDTDFILLSEPLFAYIVWIFLPFLTYPVAPPYLLSCGNEDTIFDPGISIYHSFMPGVSHRSGTFIKFNTNIADKAASTGVDVRHGGATTTVTSLDAGHGSGNIVKPHPCPMIHLSQEQSCSFRDRLAAKKESLWYCFYKAYKKVKKLEKTVKTRQAKRKARIVVFNDEEDLEDPSKQGRKIDEIDQDPDISLVQHDAEVQGRHEHDMEPNFEFTTIEEVYTYEKEVNTVEPVSTAGASVSTAGASSAKDKGKAIMEEDNIQARVEANEKFSHRLQSEEREMYFEAEKARLLTELINERKRYVATQRAEERRNKPLTQA